MSTSPGRTTGTMKRQSMLNEVGPCPGRPLPSQEERSRSKFMRQRILQTASSDRQVMATGVAALAERLGSGIL